MFQINKIAGLALAMACAVSTTVASAQPFPSKPITAVVYGAPGTTPDLFVRSVALKMGAALGQPLVVDNRPGASGVVATTTALKAPADGYTLLFTSSTSLVNTQYTLRKVPFDPFKDLTPIGTTFAPVEVLVVRADLPFKTLPELISYARQHPGKLSYGAAGVGSIFHLNGELFASTAGIKLLHVPYKGPVAAMQDMAAGSVDMVFTSFAGLEGMLSTGKMRVIATLDAQRYKGLPDVPTVAETLPGYQKIDSWFALMGPANLPKPLVDRLNAELNKALQSQEMARWMDQNVAVALPSSPAQVTQMMKTSSARIKTLVDRLGVKPE